MAFASYCYFSDIFIGPIPPVRDIAVYGTPAMLSERFGPLGLDHPVLGAMASINSPLPIYTPMCPSCQPPALGYRLEEISP
jgi:hypothetical protein